jgi:hypothetical protein
MAAVEIQQRGHSGKALEKKKYGGRNSGTENENMNSQERGNFYLSGSLEDLD